jgi:hypothetical protein
MSIVVLFSLFPFLDVTKYKMIVIETTIAIAIKKREIIRLLFDVWSIIVPPVEGVLELIRR